MSFKLSSTEKTAILCFQNIKSSVSEYYIEKELQKILKKHFGNEEQLHIDGLKIHYQELKEEIIKRNVIGLVLYGLQEMPEIHNIPIYKYTTKTGKQIILHVRNICQNLYQNYFFHDEVIFHCHQSPKFDIYYKK